MVLTQVLTDDFSRNPLQHLAHHSEQGDGSVVAGLRPRVLFVHADHCVTAFPCIEQLQRMNPIKETTPANAALDEMRKVVLRSTNKAETWLELLAL